MKINIEMNFFDGSSAKFEVAKKRFIIGRSEKADVVVTKEGFSREHCMVEYEDDGFYITDLNSTNGVRINNQELPKNIKTHYDSFLPLSIGFAESVAFEVLENTRPTGPLAGEEISRAIEVRKKIKEEHNETAELKPKAIGTNKVNHIKKEETHFAIKLVLIFIIAAAFVFYFFMNKEEMENDGLDALPSPETYSIDEGSIEF